MNRIVAVLLPAAMLSVAAPASTAVAAPEREAVPRVHAATFDQLAQPLPLPYDGVGDAKTKVAAARARAIRSHKRLLIDFGGNWCLDCRLLAGVMDAPEMRRFVASYFEVVTVDVGRFSQNLDIAAAYGVKGRLAGVPAVLIVEPRSNRVVNKGAETALADARSLTPQALADWLGRWI